MNPPKGFHPIDCKNVPVRGICPELIPCAWRNILMLSGTFRGWMKSGRIVSLGIPPTVMTGSLTISPRPKYLCRIHFKIFRRRFAHNPGLCVWECLKRFNQNAWFLVQIPNLQKSTVFHNKLIKYTFLQPITYHEKRMRFGWNFSDILRRINPNHGHNADEKSSNWLCTKLWARRKI